MQVLSRLVCHAILCCISSAVPSLLSRWGLCRSRVYGYSPSTSSRRCRIVRYIYARYDHFFFFTLCTIRSCSAYMHRSLMSIDPKRACRSHRSRHGSSFWKRRPPSSASTRTTARRACSRRCRPSWCSSSRPMMANSAATVVKNRRPLYVISCACLWETCRSRLESQMNKCGCKYVFSRCVWPCGGLEWHYCSQSLSKRWIYIRVRSNR